MANKSRSEIFYQEAANKSMRENRYKKNVNRRGPRPKKNKHLGLKILGILVLIFVLYQYRVGKAEVSINKAVASVKDADIKKQEEYFEKLGQINEDLAESYSDDQKEREDFLKASYANLDVNIKSEEKSDKGLVVIVEVSNTDPIAVLDRVKKDDPNFHRAYMDALSKESKNKNKKEAKLLLKRKFTGYKIYEDRDFVDGILGGALKYSK